MNWARRNISLNRGVREAEKLKKYEVDKVFWDTLYRQAKTSRVQAAIPLQFNALHWCLNLHYLNLIPQFAGVSVLLTLNGDNIQSEKLESHVPITSQEIIWSPSYLHYIFSRKPRGCPWLAHLRMILISPPKVHKKIYPIRRGGFIYDLYALKKGGGGEGF